MVPKGTVVIAAGEQRQRGRVANISIGGMLAMTSVTAPERLLGRAAHIDLRLDDREAEWVKLTGKILRIGADSVALSFDVATDVFVGLIDQIGNSAHIDRRRLSVVLIDATESRRAAMAAGFRDNGCAVLEASTALEAIVRLGEASFEPSLIAIADSIPSETSDDLRAFVEREHPQAKLVAIGDSVTDPGGILHWISSADPDSDLVTRVRRLLAQPKRR
jgi:hypothetical protein